MKVFTSRMGYQGDDWLDVTALGNKRRIQKGEVGGHRGIGAAFAPSRTILMPALDLRRQNSLTDEKWRAYVDAYTAEMRESYVQQRAAWETLLSWSTVTALCFCIDPDRCHRLVLARDILTRLGAKYEGERS